MSFAFWRSVGFISPLLIGGQASPLMDKSKRIRARALPQFTNPRRDLLVLSQMRYAAIHPFGLCPLDHVDVASSPVEH